MSFSISCISHTELNIVIILTLYILELGPIPKVVPLYANEIKATEDFQKTTMHNSIFSSKQNRQSKFND